MNLRSNVNGPSHSMRYRGKISTRIAQDALLILSSTNAADECCNTTSSYDRCLMLSPTLKVESRHQSSRTMTFQLSIRLLDLLLSSRFNIEQRLIELTLLRSRVWSWSFAHDCTLSLTFTFIFIKSSNTRAQRQLHIENTEVEIAIFSLGQYYILRFRFKSLLHDKQYSSTYTSSPWAYYPKCT